jgi:hypothetical protein
MTGQAIIVDGGVTIAMTIAGPWNGTVTVPFLP